MPVKVEQRAGRAGEQGDLASSCGNHGVQPTRSREGRRNLVLEPRALVDVRLELGL